MLSRGSVLLSRAAVLLASWVQEEGSLLTWAFFLIFTSPAPIYRMPLAVSQPLPLHGSFAYTFIRPARLLCPFFSSLFVSLLI